MVTSTPCLLFYCTVFCWAFKHETCLLLSPQWSNLHAPPLCFVGAYTQWMFASQYHVRILLKWTHHHFLTKSSWCCVPITPLLRLWIFWTSSSTLLWTSTCTPTPSSKNCQWGSQNILYRSRILSSWGNISKCTISKGLVVCNLCIWKIYLMIILLN